MPLVTVEINDTDYDFDVTDEAYNQYLNEMTQDNKVNPSFNFLSRTINDDQKKSFKELVTANGTVKGAVVLQVAGAIAQEFMSSDITINIKKPKSSPNE